MDHRPSDVAGDSLLARVRVLKTANKNAANQLDDVARGLVGNRVDYRTPLRDFLDEGLTIVLFGPVRLNFFNIPCA